MLPIKPLRSHISRRTRHARRHRFPPSQLLRQPGNPKIGYSRNQPIALEIDQNIFRLNIAMNNSLIMRVLQPCQNSRHQFKTLRHRHRTRSLHHLPQRPTLTVVRHQIPMGTHIFARPARHNIRMLKHHQKPEFSQKLMGRKPIVVQLLQRIQIPRLSMNPKKNPPKLTPPYQTQNAIVRSNPDSRA